MDYKLFNYFLGTIHYVTHSSLWDHMRSLYWLRYSLTLDIKN